MTCWSRFATAAVATVASVMGLATALGAGQLGDTFERWIDHPAIAYTAETADPVSQLAARLNHGIARLQSDGPSGYLRSVLAGLDVPVESQILVFAQDSVQRTRITASKPRALYFNDSVVVGWVPGGFIELAAQDPVKGVVFFTLAQRADSQPSFARHFDCLSCHYSFTTTGVPGMLDRSAGHFTVDHRVPFDERWGGWYVTGMTGPLEHRGNVDLDRLYTSSPSPDRYNWPSLEGKINAGLYLSAQSDVVALMLFEHQMHLMNLLTRIGWEARVKAMDPAAATVALDEAAVEVVDYMLFVDEPPLPGPVRGATTFAETFAARGPFDRHGRSLRQLDLSRRLMRYPCSYLIYSPQFEALPRTASDAIYRRMWQVLSGADSTDRYARLSKADRSAIIGILRDTKPDLPAYFVS
jgi:hypothetical protein